MAYGDTRDTFADLMSGGNEALVRAILALEARISQFTPADHGFIGWAGDIVSHGSSGIPTAGQLNCVRVRVPASTITYLAIGIQGAPTGLTSGQNFAMLFSAAGVLLGVTADQTSAWATTGLKVMALTAPVAVPAGDVYVAFFANWATTGPTLSKGSLTVAIYEPGVASGLPVATTAVGVQSLPSTTLNLALSTGLPSTGGFIVVHTDKGQQIVWYSGITGNQLTGCTGGAGSIANGSPITAPGIRYGTAQSGLTTVPPATITGLTAGPAYWAAVA